MTKANLISGINAQLTAIITQAKVRASALLSVNEMYPSTSEELYIPTLTTALTNTTSINTQRRYALKMNKSGNRVVMTGYIENFSGTIIGNLTWLNISNTEFYGQTFALDQIFEAHTTDGETVLISISGDTFYIIGNVSASRKYYFNFTYITKD